MNRIDEIMKSRNIEPISADELEEMRIKSYNDSEGSLHLQDGIICEKCKNKGFIMIKKGRYETMQYCSCMEKRETITRAKKSGLGDYLKKRPNDYVAENEWQQQNKGLMIKYCKENDSKWFVMLGQSGAGKTLLCSIIANYLLFEKDRNVMYITWTDFISKLKRDIMSDNADKVSNYFEQVKNVEVLFIDELLKKYNETDLKYIIELINYRYTNNLKTLITSERTLGELLDIDEATFGRVVEKAEEYVINIKKDRSKNYRLRNLL